MGQIECPNCHTAFTVDESGYAAILNQVRDQEFKRELSEREALAAKAHEQERDLAVSEAEKVLKAQLAEQAAELAAQKEKLKTQESELSRRASEERAAIERERDELKVRLEGQQKEATAAQELAVRKALEIAKDEAAKAKEQARDQQEAAQRELDRLRQQLDSVQKEAATAQQLAVERAEHQAAEQRATIERERDELRSQVQRDKDAAEKAALAHKAELAEKLAAKDELIDDRNREIERIRDMKARLSTKMLGETLEQHCEVAFNQLRATAFRNAYFEKDNDASGGSKGDYIFRELDEGGNEVVSIMFEMKNEADDSVNRKKNDDHLKKLDKDRQAKECEYAVLVSTLEPDSELYNAGIVDVSYRYDKMYVVRPQCFIPIITLLRNAALSSLEYRQQLALARRQNVDVTNFEEQLSEFKEKFGTNMERASRKFQDAIKDIDATIKKLEKIKEELTSSERNLQQANKKLDGLTVKRLTRKNPTMKAAFSEAAEKRALQTEVCMDELGDEKGDWAEAEIIDEE